MIARNSLLMTGLIFGLSAWMSGCKDTSKAPKAGSPKPATQSENPGETTGDDPGATTGDDDDDSSELSLELSDSSQSFSFKTTEVVSIKFNIVGSSDTDNVIVGLAELPTGSTMTKSGSTVTFQWASPTAGSHDFQFLLRAKDKCVTAEGSSSGCAIDESDWGSISKKSYDVLGSSYTLEITSDSGNGTDIGNGTGSGSGNSGLIDQIASLLGGGGDITQLLSSLSNGQLQQLLGLVQNGGGGLDINTLLSLVGAFTLRDAPVPSTKVNCATPFQLEGCPAKIGR